jgi:uncharacterized membrane protein (DUF2068 family)
MLPESDRPASSRASSARGRGAAGDRHASVRVIAVWEAVKGILVLLAGGLAVYILQPDQEHLVEEIVGHFHLNPAGHTSHVFQRALEHLQDTHLVLIALGGLLYALLRFVEAYGLWFAKPWGWILGVASAALYLPLEIRELIHRFSWLSVGLFALNILIVVLLLRNRPQHAKAA